MARSGTGVYVVNLFKLLVLCGVSQTEVCRHLGLEPPVVNLWAKGRRRMPQRHLEIFEQLVWSAIGRKNDSYLETMERELGADLQCWLRGDTGQEPLLFEDPGPDAPPIVQRWWSFHSEALRLMDAWDIEINPQPLSREGQALCGKLGQYHLLDREKFDDIFLTFRQSEITQLAEKLIEVAHIVNQGTPRPMVARLRQALHPQHRLSRPLGKREAPI